MKKKWKKRIYAAQYTADCNADDIKNLFEWRAAFIKEFNSAAIITRLNKLTRDINDVAGAPSEILTEMAELRKLINVKQQAVIDERLLAGLVYKIIAPHVLSTDEMALLRRVLKGKNK